MLRKSYTFYDAWSFQVLYVEGVFYWGCRHYWSPRNAKSNFLHFWEWQVSAFLLFWIHLVVQHFDVLWLCCSVRDFSGKDSALVLCPASVSWRWLSGLRCLSNIQMKGSGLRLIISISQLTFRTIYPATPPAAHHSTPIHSLSLHPPY